MEEVKMYEKLANLVGVESLDSGEVEVIGEAVESVKARDVRKMHKKRIHAVEATVSSMEKRLLECKERGESVDELEKKLENRKEKLELMRKISKGSGEADMTPAEIKKARMAVAMTRTEVEDVFKALNIDIAVQLTKNDTKNLLAALLTCSESQLAVIMDDAKVPVVIKTVIRRLLKDMSEGSMETVEKLWDRIFGKGCLEAVQSPTIQSGIIPDAPMSREGYELLYERVIGRKIGG